MSIHIPKNITKKTIDYALSLLNHIEREFCLNSETFFQYGSSVSAIKRDRLRLILQGIRSELQNANVPDEDENNKLSFERIQRIGDFISKSNLRLESFTGIKISSNAEHLMAERKMDEILSTISIDKLEEWFENYCIEIENNTRDTN